MEQQCPATQQRDSRTQQNNSATHPWCVSMVEIIPLTSPSHTPTYPVYLQRITTYNTAHGTPVWYIFNIPYLFSIYLFILSNPVSKSCYITLHPPPPSVLVLFVFAPLLSFSSSTLFLYSGRIPPRPKDVRKKQLVRVRRCTEPPHHRPIASEYILPPNTLRAACIGDTNKQIRDK